mgnify:CR=1 FL=1
MKHKWKTIRRTSKVIVAVCKNCGVLTMQLRDEDKVRYMVEEPYHPVQGGEPCPETCEETQRKITIDTVMKT